MSIHAHDPGGQTPTRFPPPELTRSTGPQIDHLFSTLVEATFDLIEEMGTSISLLLYLHVPHDDQPILFVRQPAPHMLSPTETFRMMHTVIMLSNGRKPSAAFRHGDLAGHYNRTSGDHSDGLFVYGGIQTTDAATRINSVSRAFARVLHQFHLEDDNQAALEQRPGVHVEVVGQLVQATVAVTPGATGLHATATAADAEQAVARATIQACAPGFGFDELRRISVGTRTAVLVVARDLSNGLRLGLAISEGDILQTIALAAKRAIGHDDVESQV